MPSDFSLEKLALSLDRDLFLRTLIRELAGLLEEVVGQEGAAGYISLVGQNMGRWLNGLYRQAMGVERLTPAQVAEVLIDLKRRIGGGFSLLEQNDKKIVLANDACPFAEKVIDRPSMCMMTSNVFGVIAAENLGYAKVVLQETIAGRCPRCLVTIFLATTEEAHVMAGREYFGG
ncbi:MAG: methanogen output domain 1-containing protein [Thermodesulfobacteriota bacterium]